LMDVPELTDELLDTIVSQSDDQAGSATIRELEALRDDCLVAVMQGLRTRGYGAGEVLADYERKLFDRTPAAAPDPTRPLRLHEVRVPTDWVDYNGHINDSRYFQLSSETIDRLLRYIGMDDAYLAGGHSWFTVESHVNFAAQAKAGDHLYATAQLLAHDPKRLRVFTSMHRATDHSVVPTAEHMLLHVDTTADRPCAAEGAMLAAVERLGTAHAALPHPTNAGRSIGTKA